MPPQASVASKSRHDARRRRAQDREAAGLAAGIGLGGLGARWAPCDWRYSYEDPYTAPRRSVLHAACEVDVCCRPMDAATPCSPPKRIVSSRDRPSHPIRALQPWAGWLGIPVER